MTRASARVALLTTGGTIGQRTRADGRSSPGADVHALINAAAVPDVHIEVAAPLEKASKEIRPDDWAHLCKAAAAAFETGVNGVVILHGTDTLQYTAAALSFMLSGLSAPIVVTGSMLPGGDPRSDAIPNLRDAIRTAAYADIAEVCVVFSQDQRRTGGIIIRGCCVRKLHSTSLNAFASVSVPPLGRIRFETIAWTRGVEHTSRAPRALVCSPSLDPDVLLVKVTPSLRPPALRRMLAGTKGVVIEGTGVGHVPSDWIAALSDYGQPVVVATQCPFGGEHLGSYAGDQALLALPNVIQASFMTSETALVKLMCCLARDGTATLMRTDLAGELRA